MKNQAYKRVQEIVDELKKYPQYAQYVKQHKLQLIDSNLEYVDKLLDLKIIS